jgi:hypothetical protein
LSRQVSFFGGWIHRNVYPSLLTIFVSLWCVASGKVNRETIIVSSKFIKEIFKLVKRQGDFGLIKYLKTCHILLCQSLCGYHISDISPIGPRVGRTKRGIPTIIHALHRERIFEDEKIQRFWLTLFSIYRVLEYKGTLKTSTITDAFKGNPSYEDIFKPFIRNFISHMRGPSVVKLRAPEAFPIWKAGPLTRRNLKEQDMRNGILPTRDFSTSPLSVIGSWFLIKEDPTLFKAINYILVPSTKIYSGMTGANILSSMRSLEKYFKDMLKYIRPRFLGKLGQKEEAAGKVRVFAMVDPITQWALKPFHQMLFSLLEKKPQDGTFDQLKPLSGLKPHNGLYSFDLSAATDRLPVRLQELLVSSLMEDPEFGRSWRDLLVHRTYRLPDGKSSIRYSVGQPMGALSSWAMLAFCHHFIVQTAAWKTGLPKHLWFSNYAVLGDDVVIADKAVAMEYLRLMKALGVDVNLTKSILSPKGIGFEFAKRLIVNGKDVSPISLKEVIDSYNSYAAMVEFTRKWKLTIPGAARALGYKFRVMGRLTHPRLVTNSNLRNLWISTLPLDNMEHLIDLLCFTMKVHPGYTEDLSFRLDYVTWLIQDYMKVSKRLMMSYSARLRQGVCSKEYLNGFALDSKVREILNLLIFFREHNTSVRFFQSLSQSYSSLRVARTGTYDIYSTLRDLLKDLLKINHDIFDKVYDDTVTVKQSFSTERIDMWKKWSGLYQSLVRPDRKHSPSQSLSESDVNRALIQVKFRTAGVGNWFLWSKHHDNPSLDRNIWLRYFDFISGILIALLYFNYMGHFDPVHVEVIKYIPFEVVPDVTDSNLEVKDPRLPWFFIGIFVFLWGAQWLVWSSPPDVPVGDLIDFAEEVAESPISQEIYNIFFR